MTPATLPVTTYSPNQATPPVDLATVQSAGQRKALETNTPDFEGSTVVSSSLGLASGTMPGLSIAMTGHKNSYLQAYCFGVFGSQDQPACWCGRDWLMGWAAPTVESLTPLAGLVSDNGEQWERLVVKAAGFTNLPHDWDTYGGVPTVKSAFGRGMHLLNAWLRNSRDRDRELPVPFASPCGDGSLQLDWSVGRNELEIVIPSGREVSYRYLLSTLGPERWEDTEGVFESGWDPEAIDLLIKILSWTV